MLLLLVFLVPMLMLLAFMLLLLPLLMLMLMLLSSDVDVLITVYCAGIVERLLDLCQNTDDCDADSCNSNICSGYQSLSYLLHGG